MMGPFRRRRVTNRACHTALAARTNSLSVNDELASLTARLVEIDSINPDLIPGGAGEGEIAAFVAEWLRDAGLEVELYEAAPGRPNVTGVARGTGGGSSLLLNAHMDTVGVAGMEGPFAPVVKDGRLYGRGAGDMKGSLAASMLVGAAAVREGFRGDVIVAAVADEEVGSVGAEALVRRTVADAAVVTGPTDEVVTIAHKGFVAFEAETAGFAAHGSRPDLGIDAIAETLRHRLPLVSPFDTIGDHPLRQEFLHRLVKINQANVAHKLGPEARVDQMHHRVGIAADVLIHRRPEFGERGIECC